jgi:hypothetical protein
MRYMVERNFVRVVGKIWLPPVTAAMEYPLRKYDLETIGEFTRENVERWLCTHAGDFSSIIDFYATSGDIEIPWGTEDGELIWEDCVGISAE